MVQYCVVRGCRSSWFPGTNLRYHKFPKASAQRKVWLSAVPLKIKFYESARICSLHFQESDYDFIARRLKQTAVPTIFPYEEAVSPSNLADAILRGDEELESDVRSADDDIVPPSEPHTLHLHTARICRVCLALDVKMFPLRDSELTIMFHTITGIQLEDNEGSNVRSLICWECAARLRAASTFRSKALLSDTLLQRLINKGDEIENSYFETVKQEADRSIPPKTLTLTEIIHIVDIEDQNNTSQLVQSCDDDQHSISDKISDTQESKIDENILMDVEEDANVAIITKIEDHPTYCNTEDENITKIINYENHQFIEISRVEETVNFGSSILLDIGHTTLPSDLTSSQEDCDSQISKIITETTTKSIVPKQNIELENANKRRNLYVSNDHAYCIKLDYEDENKNKKLKTWSN